MLIFLNIFHNYFLVNNPINKQLFCVLDTIFIITTPDFLNELKKVDDIFLGIRLNMNAINFICSIIFLKYTIFDKEKYMKIRRLEKYFLIINLISIIIQILLHLRIRHVIKKPKAKKYYFLYIFFAIFNSF